MMETNEQEQKKQQTKKKVHLASQGEETISHTNLPKTDETNIQAEIPKSEEIISNEPPLQSNDDFSKSEKNKAASYSKRRNFGFFLLAIFCVLLFSTNNLSGHQVDEQAAIQALQAQQSTNLPIGAILSDQDEAITSKDYTITHTSNEKETTISIWDFADEDGDYVQLFVNGEPYSDAFLIQHKPVQFTVPSEGEIQVKGIRDGVGGISYAIYFPLNETTYFNSAAEGSMNTYTLLVP